jgi:hypothetical protein
MIVVLVLPAAQMVILLVPGVKSKTLAQPRSGLEEVLGGWPGEDLQDGQDGVEEELARWQQERVEGWRVLSLTRSALLAAPAVGR